MPEFQPDILYVYIICIVIVYCLYIVFLVLYYTKVKNMEKTIITIRIDEKLKNDAQDLFDDIGLSMSAAINIFLKQCVKDGKIPFELAAKPKTSNAGRKIKPLHS